MIKKSELMFFTVFLSIAILHDGDCLRFEIPQDSEIFANSTGSALFKWLYMLEGNEKTSPVPPKFECGYLKDATLVPAIEKHGEDPPEISSASSNDMKNRVEVYSNPNNDKEFGFTLRFVQKEDPVLYRCDAAYVTTGDEIASINSDKLKLVVVYPPDISKCISNIQPTRFDSTLSVSCEVTGNPAPTVKCDLMNGNNETLQTTGERLQNISNFGFTDLKFAQKVICYISNERTGKYRREEDITIYRPPYKPKELQQYFPSGALRTSIYLRWRPIPGNETGGELDGYEVYYWMQGRNEITNKTIENVGFPQERNGYIRYEIKNLNPKIDYFIRVYGKNQYFDYSNWDYSQMLLQPSTGPLPPEKSTKNKVGVIIGIAIGCVVFLIIAVFFCVYCTVKRSEKNKRFPTSYLEDAVDYPPNQAPKLYSDVEKKPRKYSRDDSTSGYPDLVNDTQYAQMDMNRSGKSASSYEESNKVYC